MFACALGSFPAWAASTRSPQDGATTLLASAAGEAGRAVFDFAALETGLGLATGSLSIPQRAASAIDFMASPAGLLCLFAFAIVAGGLVMLLRGNRETGELSLGLGFPEAIDGDFDVRLDRVHPRSGRAPSRRRRGAEHERHGVRRETQFDRVSAGRWLLSIEGTLRSAGSRTSLLRVDEEIEIEIEAGRCLEIEHVLPEVETPIEFRIHWDRQPARDVAIGLAGRPDTLRHAEKGQVKIALPLGAHAIVIGAGDRVVEQTIDVTSYEPSTRAIDLATSSGVVFKGCPPAVAPFLEGDLANASGALERDGQRDVASLLLARLHQEQGQTERAAEALEAAGREVEAAELRRALSDFGHAATLFERADELPRAAEMYAAAGDWPEAARVYSLLESFGEAARCFEQAGDAKGWIDAVAAGGDLFRAAALASEHGDRARSIRLLQQIGPAEERYGRAGELLALAYEQEGHLDLAARQLERCLAALPPGEQAPQLEIHLSELLEDSGELARALEVLETLRDREPTFPRVASKIESLRKKLTAPPRERQSTPFPSLSGATQFVAQERYEILEEVGRGGMGHVYKALDRRLGRTVALKRMPESLRDHPAAVQLFLGEAQAAARMNHPNIVTLYDADQENGRFFITMELLEGLPLNAILEKRSRFGPRDTARLGLQACAGLQFAHDQGIVHRDIKTSNLFITRDRVLKIMDFGLAKILEAVRDQGTTVIAGTPFYMAPEQTDGHVVDGRTDLYSLGVTLFELSTGRLPFSEGNVPDQHRNAARPDPAEGIAGYPAKLSQLIRSLMSSSPGERPSSADEVARVLAEVIADR